MAATFALPVVADEPWDTLATRAQREDLARLCRELGIHGQHNTSVPSLYLPTPELLDELPPLRFRCSVVLSRSATNDDLARLARHPGIFSLAVRESRITEAGIKHLAALKGVDRLELDHNELGDECLPAIAALRTVRSLNLTGTRVTGAGVRHLAGRDLERLELPVEARDNAGLKHFIAAVRTFDRFESHYDWPLVTEDGLAVLEGRESLRTLIWRADKKVDLTFRRVLPTLTGLVDLHLEGASIGDDDLRRLAPLSKLAKLNISGTLATDAGMVHLAALKNLRILYLSRGNITDEGLKVIAKIPSLRTLNLIGADVTDAGMKALADHSQVETLDIRGTAVTEAGLLPFAGKKLSKVYTDAPLESEALFLLLWPNMSISGSVELQQWRLSDLGLAAIAKRRPKGGLNLRGAFTDKGLELLGTLDELEALRLDLSVPLAEESCRHLAKLKKLESLSLAGQVSDHALPSVAALGELKNLSLASDRLSDAALSNIASLKRLQYFGYSGTLSEKTAAVLAELPHLGRLDVAELPEASAKALARSTSLRIMGLRHSKFDDKALVALAPCKSLEWMDVTFANVTPEGKAAFHRLNPKCELYEGE
jgi:Leucine-rich repeat (LRR) protein